MCIMISIYTWWPILLKKLIRRSLKPMTGRSPVNAPGTTAGRESFGVKSVSAVANRHTQKEAIGKFRALAKATPHMFVINPEGVVVYAGAIDDNSSANPAVIPKSTNYVAAALDAGMKGEPIQVASTRAYGCSVKY